MAQPASAASSVASRRSRIREQTAGEILAAARSELIGHGAGGISLRGVARSVGMTAPGLYRYFPSLEELVAALTVELFDELCLQMADSASSARDPFDRMLLLSRAFRSWALAHPAEFGLLFAVSPTAWGQRPSNPCQAASDRFGTLFAETFISMWETAPFEVPSPEEISPDLREALSGYWTWLTGAVAPSMPLGAVVRYMEGWVRIFGCVAMDTFGHLSWAMPDGEAMLEQVLRSLAEMVGRPDAYRPPEVGRDAG